MSGKSRLLTVIKILALLLLALLVTWYLPKIRFQEVKEALKEADLTWIASAFCFVVGLWSFRSSLLWIVVQTRFRVSYIWIVSISVLGGAIDQIIPGRTGQVMRWALLNFKYPNSKGFFLSALASAIVVEGMALLALFFLAFLTDESIRTSAPPLVTLILGILFLGIILFFIFARRLEKFIPARWLEKVGALKSFFEILNAVKKPRLFAAWVLAAAIAWICQILILYCVGRGFNLDLKVFQIAVILLSVNLAVVIPIVPANVGTVEVVITSILLKMGYPQSSALALALVYHSMHVLPVLTAGGIISIFFPLKKLKAEADALKA